MSSDEPALHERDAVSAAALVAEIRRWRTGAGLSQTELANRVGYSREYVSRAERPGRGLPSTELVRSLDAALNADGALVAMHAAAHDERLGRRGPEGCVRLTTTRKATDHDAPTTAPGGGERGVLAPAEIRVATSRADGSDTSPNVVAEVARQSAALRAVGAAESSAALLADVIGTDIDPLTVEDIEERVDALANGYFRTGPVVFRQAVLQLRERVQALVAVRSSLPQRRRLYVALASLTAMVAESSFAIGDATDIHCAAAIALADEAGHDALVGWVRGTQAQIALHTGSPAAAVRYARAGQGAPRGSTAAVRSASYLARASARIGDRAAAHQAWRAAEDAWDELDGALTDSVFSLSPNYLPYCELTILAWLGETKRATALADAHDPACGSPTVGRAIGQIDVALVRIASGEVDEAVRVGDRALAIATERLTTPLRDRFTDLVAALAPHDSAVVNELRRRWTWISA